MAAKAVGYLELNIDGFDKAIKSAKNLLAGMAGAFAAFKTGEFFKDGIKDAIDFGHEMDSLGNKLGNLDPGKVLLIQKALEQGGQSAGEAQSTISNFIDQNRNLADAFGGSTQFAQALDQASNDYGKQAQILTESHTKLSKVWDSIESVTGKVREFFLGLASQFIEPLQATLNYLNSLDLGSVGERFGKALTDATAFMVGALKNGNLFKTLSLGLEVGFKEAVNYLAGGFNWLATGGVDMIKEGLVSAYHEASSVLADATRAIFGNDLVDYLVGASATFLSKMLEAVNAIGKALGAATAYAIQSAIEAVPGASEVLGIGGAQHQSFSEMMGSVPNVIPTSFIKSLADAGEQLKKPLSESLSNIFKKVIGSDAKQGFAPADLFSDLKETKDEFKKLVSSNIDLGKSFFSNAEASRTKTPVLNTLSKSGGTGRYVIADQLAKIGGGGNFLNIGMSLSERSALRTAKATEATAEATQQINRREQERRGSNNTLMRR